MRFAEKKGSLMWEPYAIHR